jgi:hypothetical protein
MIYYDNERHCPQCDRALTWYPSRRKDAHPNDGHGEALYTHGGKQICNTCLYAATGKTMSNTIAGDLQALEDARMKAVRESKP